MLQDYLNGQLLGQEENERVQILFVRLSPPASMHWWEGRGGGGKTSLQAYKKIRLHYS